MKKEVVICLKYFENKIYNFLSDGNHNTLEQPKIRYGVRLIVSNLYSLFVVYGLSFLLDCVLVTIITHFSFFLLRQVTNGYHFSNKYSCIILSLITFPLSSKILTVLSERSFFCLNVFVRVNTTSRYQYQKNHDREAAYFFLHHQVDFAEQEVLLYSFDYSH